MGSAGGNRRHLRFDLICLISAAFLLAACATGRPVADLPAAVPAPCGVAETEWAALPRVADLMDPTQAARVRATAAMLSDLPPPVDLAALIVATDPDLENVPAELPDPLPTWTEGDETIFMVPDPLTGEPNAVTAELVHASDRIYAWLQAGQARRNRIRRLAARFDGEPLLSLQAIFGTPPDHGFDRDPRVHMLFAKLEESTAGSFSNVEAISRLAVPDANEKDMVFINARTLEGTDYDLQVLAHEYVHLLHWAISPGEQEFIDEGLAELPMLLGTFGEAYLNSLVLWSRDPYISLTGWSEGDPDNELHYGAALGYAAWLTDTFGLDAARELVAHPDPGTFGVDGFLRDRGCGLTFDDTYADFSLAAFLGRPHRYGSAGSLGIRSLVAEQDPVWTRRVADGRLTADRPLRASLPPYATRYLRVSGDELETPGTIVFRGNPQVAVLADLDPARPVLWSGRWSDRHASLTLDLDLTSLPPGTAATLETRLWWDIEEDWDYAYLMVSRDGEEWTLLESGFTTDADGSTTNLGPGLTGDSGGWQAVAWDLGPWSGAAVQLRISMVADSVHTRPGLVIGGLEVPETGWGLDPAEPWPAGARPDGWHPVRRPLAVTWLVQSVIIDTRARTVRSVQRAVAGADGLLVLEPVDRPGPHEELFLLVSPLVPQVMVPIDYTVELHRH